MSQSEFVEQIRSLDWSGQPTRLRGEVGELNVENEAFPHPIDLSGIRFKGTVRLKRCQFESSVTVKGASFSQGAAFVDCDFRGAADFSWTVFSGLCYFWRSRFAAYADFSNCVVKLAEDASERASPYLLSGETNFSWARFIEGASFYRMQFGGPAWFWRTLLRGDTNFDESKFAASVRFFGAEDHVSLARHDVSNPSVLDHLLNEEILVRDDEGPEYYLMNAIKSKDALALRLRNCGVSGEAARELSELWVNGAVATFSADATTSFRSVTLDEPKQCEFAETNLDNCLFSGTSVKEIRFANVTWSCGQVFPRGARSAVRDELVAPTEYEPVGRVYGELEQNYNGSGRYGEASDFRYGRMEMLRRAEPAVLRNMSILAAYKYLSGYGEHYGLALTWLVLFVLIVFPALYLMLGLEGGAGRAVLHSLEVSTFLEPTGTSTSQIATRFVEGIERLLVPLQAGLFFLAVNRRVGRA